MVQITVWSSVEVSSQREIKLKYRENYKDMDHTYRTRQSGQGCRNKLIIICIVMKVPKQRIQEGSQGGGHFCNLKLICLKHLVYGIGYGMEWYRDWQIQVNKIEIW